VKYLYEIEYERTSYGGKKTKGKTRVFATSPKNINTYRLGGFQEDTIRILKTKKIRAQHPVEVDCDVKRNELSFLISVDEHLDSTLEKAEDLEARVAQIEEDDGVDVETALEQLGYVEVAHDNTYNYGSDFENELDLKVFLPEGSEESDWYYNEDALVYVREHTGLDVRAGYKDRGIFKPSGHKVDGLADFLNFHVRLAVLDNKGDEVDYYDGEGAAYNLLKEYKLVSCKNGNIKVKKDGKTYDVSYYHPVYGV